RSHRYGMLPCSRVQALNLAAFLPGAHQPFEPVELFESGFKGSEGCGFVRRPCAKAKLGSHGRRRTFDESGRGCLRLLRASRYEDENENETGCEIPLHCSLILRI